MKVSLKNKTDSDYEYEIWKRMKTKTMEINPIQMKKMTSH